MRFDKLLEAVPDALVGMNHNGVIRFVNRQCELLFGYQREELVGQPIDMLVPETLWQIYTQHRQDYFADPRTRSSGLDVQLSGRHHNGGEFPINVNMSQIDTADVLLVITGVDEMTAQQQAVKNAGLVEAIVEYSDDAIIGCTLQGTITSWNPAAETMYGYSHKEVVGRSVTNLLVPPDRIQETQDNLAKISAGHHVRHVETERLRKDGTVVSVSITVAPVRNADGAIVGASAIHRDVSGQRQAFEAAENLAAIVQSSDDAILSCTLDGTVTSWNPAAEAMFGYTCEEIVGKTGLPRVPLDRIEEAEAALEQAKAGQHVKHLETARVRKDDTVVLVSLTISPIRDPGAVIVGVSVIARDVTEQRQAAEATQRLAAIVESSDDAIIGRTLTGVITSWNPAAEAMFGYTSEEVVGESVQLLIPEGQRDEAVAALSKVVTGQPVKRLETTRIRKDGTIFPASVTLSPMLDASGTITGVSAIYRDVTEQQWALEAAQRLAAIVQSSQDAIVSVSPDGIMTSWNPAAEALFGYSREEIVGQPLQLLVPRDRAGEIRDFRDQIRADHRVGSLETERVRKDGTLVPVSVTVSPVRDTDGAVIGTFGSYRNITAQQEAFRTAQALAAIVQSSDDAIFGSTLEGTITSWNQAATRLFGYSSGEMIGQSGRLLNPKDRTDEVKTILAKVGAGQHVEHLETIRVRKDGTAFPISLTVSPIRDANGAVIGASSIGHDMTRAKRAEQAVEQDRATLRATMDSLLDPHVLLDAVHDEAGQIVDFVFADANPAACEYAQKTYDEMTQMRLSDLFHDTVRAESLVDQCRRVIRTDQPLVLDDVVYTQGLIGKQRHYDVRGARVGDGLSYTWRDVTDRHVAAEWLAESQEHYRLLAENASDVVMRLGTDQRFEWVSGSVADVLDWTAEDLLGHVIDEFIHPDEQALFWRAVADTSPESTASTEFRFRRSDGTYRWVLCHTRLRLDEDGAAVALVGGLVDIDARKVVEAHDLDRMETLERFQRLSVGRELKMIELKKEIENLRQLVYGADADVDGAKR